MKEEIELIKNEELKKFAYFCMDKVPKYFFKVAASSTGKYHPSYTLGEGGLVRHVKAAVKIANSLLDLEQNQDLNRDCIIFALIFTNEIGLYLCLIEQYFSGFVINIILINCFYGI